MLARMCFPLKKCSDIAKINDRCHLSMRKEMCQSDTGHADVNADAHTYVHVHVLVRVILS